MRSHPLCPRLALVVSMFGVSASADSPPGLVALYDFRSPSGDRIVDRTGGEDRADLIIQDLAAVRRSAGSLEVTKATIIRSEKPPTRLLNAIRRSGQMTVEAWVRPAKVDQEGPARIVSLSASPTLRNFTLGQERDKFDARLRTTRTSKNGMPSLSSSSKTVRTSPTHLAYTRTRDGQTTLYVNGMPVGQSRISGDMSNWDASHPLLLANEATGDRPWLGSYQMIAVYSRALTPREIERNCEVGADEVGAEGITLEAELAAGNRMFQHQVAPILARHCLECHDTATAKGKLDLSSKVRALAGGESGAAIVAGKPDQSLVWEMIASNEMPLKRPSLSANEKQTLRKWIAAGAVWPVETIDPAVYVHAGRAGDIWVQRLTVAEYIATVRATFGLDVAAEAKKKLPPDLRADGFANTAYNLSVDLPHVEAYAELAETIAGRLDAKEFARRFSRSSRLTDPNMRPLIANMGNWVLRGPLSDEEVATYRGISTTVASAGGSFEDAVRFVVQAMIQSPRFIYRVEEQQGDGGSYPVRPFELASRISYIVWGSSPDRELHEAAARGDLSDANKLAAQLDRMLRDPRAVERSCEFVSQWLNLSRLQNLRPHPQRFPGWNPQLADDMRTETIEFFKDVAWKQQRPLSDLLNAQVGYFTPRLAAHYGLNSARAGLQRYDVTKVRGRGGLLTHGSVLTIGGDQASMVTRGLFVLHDLLRGVVKDPPPCVDTTPIATKEGQTQRDIALSRIANANCGGCHARFEPLAFGLEKFDGLGTWRERDEHGNPLREDGVIVFPGRSEKVEYQSASELMDLLAASPRVQESITWKVTQFCLGRPLVGTDAQAVAKIHQDAKRAGGTYASLIRAIVTSDLVQLTRTETTE